MKQKVCNYAKGHKRLEIGTDVYGMKGSNKYNSMLSDTNKRG